MGNEFRRFKQLAPIAKSLNTPDPIPITLISSDNSIAALFSTCTLPPPPDLDQIQQPQQLSKIQQEIAKESERQQEIEEEDYENEGENNEGKEKTSARSGLKRRAVSMRALNGVQKNLVFEEKVKELQELEARVRQLEEKVKEQKMVFKPPPTDFSSLKMFQLNQKKEELLAQEAKLKEMEKLKLDSWSAVNPAAAAAVGTLSPRRVC